MSSEASTAKRVLTGNRGTALTTILAGGSKGFGRIDENSCVSFSCLAAEHIEEGEPVSLVPPSVNQTSDVLNHVLRHVQAP